MCALILNNLVFIISEYLWNLLSHLYRKFGYKYHIKFSEKSNLCISNLIHVLFINFGKIFINFVQFNNGHKEKYRKTCILEENCDFNSITILNKFIDEKISHTEKLQGSHKINSFWLKMSKIIIAENQHTTWNRYTCL